MMIGITERGDPAFDKGWVPWVEAGEPAVLVTKDFPQVLKVSGFRDSVVYHATVTGLGGTEYEPGVPRPESVLAVLNGVPKDYREHVVVRIDPIIPIMYLMKHAIQVYDWSVANGFQVRISFMDYYPHVRERLDQMSVKSKEAQWVKESLDNIYQGGLHAPLEIRKRAYSYFPKAVTCGEPGFDNVGCISRETCEVLNVPFSSGTSGQRADCACCGLKKELLSSPKRCPHGCVYCYWRGDL